MESGKILVSHDGSNYIIKLESDVRLTLCASLSQYMDTIFESESVDDVLVDLLDATGVDSTTLGLLAKLALHCKKMFGVKPTIFCVDEDLIQVLKSMGLDDIYNIVDQPPEQLDSLKPLPPNVEDVELMQQQILEAHKLLVLLSPDKKQEFINLIQCFESKI